MAAIPGAQDGVAAVNGVEIAYSRMGDGPPVLLLHGFPQTRAMWRRIMPLLAQDFTVIAADLRGYGDSTKPDRVADMTFRKMATDQVSLMAALGFGDFHVVGHDRGARTAHRMALDHDGLKSLVLMDIVPTHLLLSELQTQVAKDYYHWFFLAQPAPFPEAMISHDPDYYYHSCLSGWDTSGLEAWDAEALEAYRASWRNRDTISSMCDDYRAAIEFDIHDDARDLHRRVTVPSLVLYGRDGAMAKSYDMGDVWSTRLASMQVQDMPGGHFFPDLHPEHTARVLSGFLKSV